MKTAYWEKGEFNWGILLLCAYHFFPFITTKGSIVMYLWAYVVPIIYIALNINYLKRIISIIAYSEVLISVGCIVLLSCLSIFIPIAYGTYDFTYLTDALMTMIKILVRMLFVVIVIVKHIPCATKETFMKYFIFSCCLYICGTVVMLTIPQIKDIFYELVKESDYSKTLALESRYSTRYGWGGFSGFEYTYKCVLALIFNDYLINKKIKDKHIWYMIGVSFLLLVGTLFYGRVGLLVGLVVVAFLFLRLLHKRTKILMVVVIGVAVGFVALLILQSKSEQIRAWFVWAFDLFINFFKTGKLETDSSNILLEKMLFIPEIKTILLGDGMYTSTTGNYYMSTDAGIMRPLLFGGILFAGVRYISIFSVFIISIIKRNWCKHERRMWEWVFLTCLIFEIKGEIVFSCMPLVLWLVVLKHYEKRRNNDGKRFEF